MEGLKRRLSFRKKKKDKVPECSKPHQWQEDEKKVREGTCSFQVRYLGCEEVFESRGMQVCEEAVKSLKNKCKGKYQRAILYVSGDALRVVDEISKSMIVDQTIEKVSFCAPDRNHEKGFAYICRDGTTRRWLCHGFLAVKESRLWRSHKIKGERLSHAVGCAFAICLERKQKRDKESGGNVTVTYNQDRTTFERTGSFRQTTITERLTDPQSAIVAEPVPIKPVDNPFAVQRPHATSNMLVRQGSFRGFGKLQEASSPFKRTLSLRLNELPSTLQRQQGVDFTSPTKAAGLNNNGIIEEVPSPENEDSITQMCQQLTQGLSSLTEDPFAAAPLSTSHASSHSPGLIKQHSMPATFHAPVTLSHPPSSVQQNNPWAMAAVARPMESSPKHEPLFHGRASPATNPFLSQPSQPTPRAPSLAGPAVSATVTSTHAPFLQHTRSHSMDTNNLSWGPSTEASRKQTLLQMAHHTSFQVNGQSASAGNNGWPGSTDWVASSGYQTSATATPPINTSHQNQSAQSNIADDTFDPFDVAWAAKSSMRNQQDTGQPVSTNPFATKTVTTYKVEL